MTSHETILKINEWRMKAREGTLTREEMVEAIKLLRDDRFSAAQVAKKSADRTKKPAVSGEALLSELDGI